MKINAPAPITIQPWPLPVAPHNGNGGIVPPWLQHPQEPITILPWPFPIVPNQG